MFTRSINLWITTTDHVISINCIQHGYLLLLLLFEFIFAPLAQSLTLNKVLRMDNSRQTNEHKQYVHPMP
jgi:hypothetical protein